MLIYADLSYICHIYSVVYLLGTRELCTTAEPISMALGGTDLCGSKEPCIRLWVQIACWKRHSIETMKRLCSSYAISCQITLELL